MKKKICFGIIFLILFLILPLIYSWGEELSKEAIIQIAINKAEEIGYLAEVTKDKEIHYYGDKGVEVYDMEKKEWVSEQATVPEEEYPLLRKSDNIKVSFRIKDKNFLGGGLYVYINRDTGEVVDYIRTQ